MSVFISKQLTVPSLGKALSDYAVGESVFIPVNGISTEFLVVQQGKPSSVYDDSCDGTWLLMKDIYETKAMDAGNSNDYAASDMHIYLNGTFLGLFDAKVQNTIKQAKIPYTKGTGSAGTVTTGADGLSTKIFLLTFTEIGLTIKSTSYVREEGAVLDYFNGAENAKRLGYFNGSALQWWLRSPASNSAQYFKMTNLTGTASNAYANVTTWGVRPCIILPYDTKFDPDTNEVKA